MLKQCVRMASSTSGGAGVAKKAAIYTRTGDKGTTALFNGERRAKDDEIFQALGATDELNAALGVAREFCLAAQSDSDAASRRAKVHAELADMIVAVQCHLVDVGARIATPRIDDLPESRVAITEFSAEYVNTLERVINEMDAQLPPLTNFILPGGGLPAAHLHVARTTCRRAERRVVALVRDHGLDSQCGRYLNRLSDLLFTAARYAALVDQQPEARYQKAKGLFAAPAAAKTDDDAASPGSSRLDTTDPSASS